MDYESNNNYQRNSVKTEWGNPQQAKVVKAELHANLLGRTFMIFGIGLALVCGMGYLWSYLLSQGQFQNTYSFIAGFGFIFMFIGIFYMQSRLHSMSMVSLGIIFFLFSLVLSTSLGALFLLFNEQLGNSQDLFLIFGITGLVFGLAGGFGYKTKRDLFGMWKVIIAGFVILLISSITSWFVTSNALLTLVSAIGALLMTAITAYQVYAIRKSEDYVRALEGQVANATWRYAIIFGLSLLLTFVNLLMYIARIFLIAKN